MPETSVSRASAALGVSSSACLILLVLVFWAGTLLSPEVPEPLGWLALSVFAASLLLSVSGLALSRLASVRRPVRGRRRSRWGRVGLRTSLATLLAYAAFLLVFAVQAMRGFTT